MAHNLRYHEGNNADNFLRDLAQVYLEAGELDRALNIYDSLLRHDPADIWIYNGMGLFLPSVGLADLAIEAIQRALEIVKETNDPEDLHGQLTEMLVEAQEAERQGRESEISPEVLTSLRQALYLPLDAGHGESLEDLARSLIPDFGDIPVKRLPKPQPLPRTQDSTDMEG